MKATRVFVVCALVVAACVMAVFCVKSVTTPIHFEDTRAAREVEVIKHLVDLRTAEVEYHHQNGKFTASYDTLLTFLKTAPKKEVLKEGSLTDKQLEGGLTEPKAVKILNAAKQKALKDKKLNLDPADTDALYAYIWENDAEVKKNSLQGFRRDTIETNNDYKTSQGIRVPLFEARAPFESYLSDLDEQELVNLIDRETKLEHFAGLKVGDIYAPNNNAGNWE